MAAFDYKKAYPEFYLPPKKPHLIEIPQMNFMAIRGEGDPNEAGGKYKIAIGKLYAAAYTIKMSRLSAGAPEGYFDYVMPPLESLWRMEGACGMDYARKWAFHWIAIIRLPEFVTPEVLASAVSEAENKKSIDLLELEYFSYSDGLCVQCLHLGPYDAEPETVSEMEGFAAGEGYVPDLGVRQHHEIYLSDARRCKPERLRTVIRIPVRRAES